MTVEVRDIVAAKFFEDNPDCVPLNAVIAVEYISADGERQIATAWTSDVPYYVLDGIVRSLLRDVTAIPREFERRHAANKADEIESGDD